MSRDNGGNPDTGFGARGAERWHVAPATLVVDLRVVYNGEPQPMQVIAFDGVPVNSQDGATSAPPPEPVAATDILLGPGSRARFI